MGQTLFRRLVLIVSVVGLCQLSANAGTLKLPANAINDDTFFVVTVDAAKADPDTLATTVKAAIPDKAAMLDKSLEEYKTRYQKFVDAGLASASIVLAGDPDKQPAGPEPIFYLQFKPGSDQSAAEKLIRDDEGENNPSPAEITHDGDFMVVRKQGLEPPQTASDEKTKLFAEAIGDSDKAATAAVIFNSAMISTVQKDLGHGAPPALGTLTTDSKWIRLELTTGEAPKADATIQAADEDSGKRIVDAVSSLGEIIQAQVAMVRVMAAKGGPGMAQMADTMDGVSTAFKAAKQNGPTVTLTGDAKLLGGLLMSMHGQRSDVVPTTNP